MVLAAARSPHGSVTLSFALSVSKAATSPGVRGFTLTPLRYVETYVKRFARLL